MKLQGFILGESHYLLENRIFNTATFSIAVLTIILSFITFGHTDSVWMAIPLLVAPVIYILFFYYSRFKGHFRNSNVVFILFSFFFFDYLWFCGAAINSAVDLLFPLLLILGLTTLPVKRHLFFISGIIFNLLITDILAYSFPDWIYLSSPGTPVYEYLESHLYLALFLVLISFIISYFKLHYEREKEVTHEQNRKLVNNIQALKHRNEHLESLARMVSHNLRSPMAGMKMLFDLYDKMETPEDKEDIISNLREGAFQLFNMVEDLATIMLDYKELNKEVESLELKEVAEHVISQLAGLIKSENVKIKCDFSEYPEVEYSGVYLESIFLNLISNAVKYRNPNGNSELKIKSYLDDSKVMLSFCDNGLGIDMAQHREQLFKMYKTFHRSAGKDSKGIGLFITKNQVEMKGGKITIESEPERGTCFYIELYRL